MGCGWLKCLRPFPRSRERLRMAGFIKYFQPRWESWHERVSCSDATCHFRRRMLKYAWRRGWGVRVQGARYCFPECFEREVRRCFLEIYATPVPEPRPPHRIPLGLLMLSRGDIDDAQLRAALARQREHGAGRIGEWMQRLGAVQERQITAALGAQWGCPVLPEKIKPLSSLALDCPVPLSLLRTFRMAPVSYVAATRTMHVGFADGVNYSALRAIESVLGCRAEACICSSSKLSLLLEALENRWQRSSYQSTREFAAGMLPEEGTRITSNYAGMLGAEDVRLAACGASIWVRVDAKDDSVNLLFSLRRGNCALAG